MVEENTVICQCQADRLFAEAKSLYFTFPNDVTPQFLKKLDTLFA